METGRKTWPWVFVGMLTVLVTGCILRVEGLANLSAWVDECAFYFLGVDDLATYLDIMRFWAPDNTMLYYRLFYGWHLIFGDSLFAMRMLTVVAGLVSIPLAWLIGRRVFGEWAAWFAAICFAISPFQIWHAQSIRPYGLCIPFVLLAIYALLRVRDGWPWWVLAWLCNVVLLWLHPFMAFVLPAQVLYLWALRPHGFRKATLWSVAQLPVLVPPFLSVRPYLVNVPEAGVDHFYLPTLRSTLVDLLGDDVSRYSGEFPISTPAWLAAMPQLERLAPSLGVLLIALFGVLTIYALVHVVIRVREGDPGPLLIALVALAPVLILVTLSYVWRPCVETRHTPYASIAVYLLAGAALMAIPQRWLRRLLAFATVALLAFESAFYVTGGTHTAWREASRLVATEEKPGDTVLVRGIIPWAFYSYQANRVPHNAPVEPARTLTALAERTIAKLEGGETTRVWAIIEMPFIGLGDTYSALEPQFAPRGITQRYTELPGMLGISVGEYALSAPAEGGAPAVFRCPSMTDYVHMLEVIGLGDLEPEAHEAAVNALARVVDIPIPLGKNSAFLLAMLLAEHGEYRLVEAFARYAIEFNPRYGSAHFALGVALAGKNAPQAALASFEEAFALDPALDQLYRPLVEAVFVSADVEAAARALQRLAPTGFPYPALAQIAREYLPGTQRFL